MAAEKILENRIKRALQADSAWFIKTWAGANPSVKRGTPDILACYHGYFWSIEVKNPNGHGRIAPAQKLNAQKITQAGGVASFISEWPTFLMIKASLAGQPLTKFSPAQRQLLIHCGFDSTPEIYNDTQNLEGVW